MRKILLLMLAVILAVTSSYYFFKIRGKEKDEVKIFETQQVKRGEIKNVINATAIVKTRVNAYLKIGTRTTGLVQKMFIDIGDYVKKGQLIAIIDQREFKKNIEKIKQQLKKAEDRLFQIEKIYPLKIAEAEKNYQSATAEYEYAQWKYSREKELLKEEFTTKESFEAAKRELKFKKAKMELAEKTLEKLKVEYETEKRLAQDDINILKKELQREKIRLSYTEIYSPIDGIVSNVVAREGETLVAGLQAGELVTILRP
ncbi:MAG: biotin/lipoyl-binding protein [Persephonella sp.]|nr:biotin/lipoyl-binding protein [Persephonella sp.]